MRAAWLLVVSLFLLTGCGGEPYFLEEYEIADLEIETGDRVSRNVSGPGHALGKPTPGLLSQDFVPTSAEFDLVDVFEEIMAEAVRQGWVMKINSHLPCGADSEPRAVDGTSVDLAVLRVSCSEGLPTIDDGVLVLLVPA